MSTFVATGAVGSAVVGLTPAQPAGVAAGDLLLCLVETANEVVATPAGWTIAPSSPQGSGTAGATTAVRLSIFYRIATLSDACVFADPGDHIIARIIAYRIVDPTTPFAANAGNVAATSAAVTFPTVTTTDVNQKVLLCLANLFDTATSQAGALTNANLTSITERIDDNTASGNGGGITLIEATKATAGATGTSTLTLANTSVQARIVLVLKDAPVPTGPTLPMPETVALLHFNQPDNSTTIPNEVAGGLTFSFGGGGKISTASAILGSAGFNNQAADSYAVTAESVTLDGPFLISFRQRRISGFVGFIFTVGENDVDSGLQLEYYAGDVNLRKITAAGVVPIIQVPGALILGDNGNPPVQCDVKRDAANRIDLIVNGVSQGNVTDATTFSGRVIWGGSIETPNSPVSKGGGTDLDEIAIVAGDQFYTTLPFTPPTGEYALEAVSGNTYNVSAADAATAADASTSLLTSAPSATDPVTTADVATILGTFGKAASDAAAATDVSTANVAGPKSATDSATATDVSTSAGVSPQAAVDPVTTADIAASVTAGASAAADSVATLDASSSQSTIAPAASDAVTVVDASSTQGAFGAIATDAAAASDSASRLYVQTAPATDAATATDAANSQSAYAKAATDAAVAADSAASLSASASAATDTISSTDSAVSLSAGGASAATDTAPVTDTSTVRSTMTLAASDAATAQDSSNTDGSTLMSAQDSVTVTDAATTRGTFGAPSTDAISATDAATAKRTQAASGADSVAVTDSAVTGTNATAVNALDAASAADSSSLFSVKPASAQDLIVANDAASQLSALSANAVDSLSLLDFTAIVGVYTAIANDDIIVLDEVFATGVYTVVTSDGITLIDIATVSESIFIANERTIFATGANRSVTSIGANRLLMSVGSNRLIDIGEKPNRGI